MSYSEIRNFNVKTRKTPEAFVVKSREIFIGSQSNHLYFEKIMF